MRVKPSAKRRKGSIRAGHKGSLRAKLVRIGNSRGIRLPKAVIEQAGLTTDLQIDVEGDRIVVRSAPQRVLRADWDARFKAAIAKHGPVSPIDPDWESTPNEFDEKEWHW